MKLVEELDYQFNFIKLKNECPNITRDTLGLRMKGLSIQHRKNILDPWNIIDGLESIRHYDKNCTEKDFNIVHSNFKNTEYEKIINDFNLDAILWDNYPNTNLIKFTEKKINKDLM